MGTNMLSVTLLFGLKLKKRFRLSYNPSNSNILVVEDGADVFASVRKMIEYRNEVPKEATF